MRGSFFTLRTFHASSVNQWLVGKRVQGDALDKVNDQIIGFGVIFGSEMHISDAWNWRGEKNELNLRHGFRFQEFFHIDSADI